MFSCLNQLIDLLNGKVKQNKAKQKNLPCKCLGYQFHRSNWKAANASFMQDEADAGCLPQPYITSFIRQGLPLNLNFADSPTPASQRALGSSCLYPLGTGITGVYRCAQPFIFKWMLLIELRFVLVWQSCSQLGCFPTPSTGVINHVSVSCWRASCFPGSALVLRSFAGTCELSV